MRDQLALFRKIPLFNELGDGDIDALIGLMQDRVVPSGGRLFTEGESSSTLYVVWTGSIQVFRTGPDGKEQTLSTLGLGDCLGEMGLVRETQRCASARATKETLLMTLTRESLQSLSQSNPRVWGRIMANLARILADRMEAVQKRSAQAPAAPATAEERGFVSRLLGW